MMQRNECLPTRTLYCIPHAAVHINLKTRNKKKNVNSMNNLIIFVLLNDEVIVILSFNDTEEFSKGLASSL